jgi:glutaconate CoA-transferase subunit B
MWGGPYAVVSTMGVMKFAEGTHEMYLDGYFADLGVTPDQVKENTGFSIDVSRATPINPPTDNELRILRTKVDPEGIFMKY